MKNKGEILWPVILVTGGLLGWYYYNKSKETEEEREILYSENIWDNLTNDEQAIFNFISEKYRETLDLDSLSDLEASMAVITYMSPYYYDQNQCHLAGLCIGGATHLGLVPPNEWNESMCTNPDDCVFNDYDDWREQYYYG